MPRNLSARDTGPMSLTEDGRTLTYNAADLEHYLINSVKYLPQNIPQLLDKVKAVFDLQHKAPDINALFRAVVEDETDVVEVILKCITDEEKLKLLKLEVENTTMIGLIVENKGEKKMTALRLILRSLESFNSCFEILASKFRDGGTAIHSACKVNNFKALNIMLNRIERARCFQVLKIKDFFKFTALHYGCEKGHHKTISALLSHLEPDERLKLALIKAKYGQTALDLAAEAGKTEVIRSLKASIKDDEWFRTLKHCDVLYCASQYDQLDVIKTVLESIDYDQRYEILMKDTYNRTPLHIIAERGNIAILKAIQDVGLNGVHWEHLLTLTDSQGCTPLHYAVLSGNRNKVIELARDLINDDAVWRQVMLIELQESNVIQTAIGAGQSELESEQSKIFTDEIQKRKQEELQQFAQHMDNAMSKEDPSGQYCHLISLLPTSLIQLSANLDKWLFQSYYQLV